jgi:hypothetical protein
MLKNITHNEDDVAHLSIRSAPNTMDARGPE